MKHLLESSLLFATGIIFMACGGSSSTKKTNDTTASHDHVAMEQNEVQTNPVLKNDKLNAVYQHYIHLTTALTNDDVAEARIAANAIEAGAKDVDGASAIVSSAAKISSQSDIEAQRETYAVLSNDFISLIKNEGMKSGELYVDFCPMAFNDKGANWISNQKEIVNPYFGKKMLKCGEIKDTLH
jgi:hypothetical protein